jgi:hypothetical protein
VDGGRMGRSSGRATPAVPRMKLRSPRLIIAAQKP